ncbi:major facilitator superfamily transporter [Xylariaceae sp. FL0255]|nr:major facilitator superfamily transporter [Xylariaceae sp. FL0255]
MTSTTELQTFVETEPSSLPQAPKKAVSRTYPAVPQNDDPLGIGALGNTAMTSAPATPCDERDIEMSSPGIPEEPAAVTFEALPSLTSPPKNKFRFIACCLNALLQGLTDSAPGALIPYMEKYYDIGYAIVSVIFIGYALGFILAAPLVDTIQGRLGRSKALALGSLITAVGFIPLAVAAPFASIVVGYLLMGFGFATNLSISNVFTANLRNGTTLLGLMHGSYGIGGTVGPLIATSIVSALGDGAWHRYYFLTIATTVFVAAWYAWSFAGYEREAALAENPILLTATSRTPTAGSGGAQRHIAGMLRAFKSRVVLLGAIFIFAYQGAEVSISGWVISFLIAARKGDPTTVGNVTSGFWGGITLGRFVLSPLGARLGEKRFVYIITVGAAIFQLLVWLVPNIIGEAVSLAVVGLLLGPVYPCAATVFTRSLSRREQVSGLSVISAFGSSGGAVAPFITGLLAQAVGTFVLHPIAIGLFAGMLACWYALPTVQKRTE